MVKKRKNFTLGNVIKLLFLVIPVWKLVSEMMEVDTTKKTIK